MITPPQSTVKTDFARHIATHIRDGCTGRFALPLVTDPGQLLARGQVAVVRNVRCRRERRS